MRTPEGEELPDLVSAPDNAPSVTVSWALGSSLVDIPDLVENGRYQFAHRGGGILEVIRDPGSVRMLFPVPASPAAVVHPILTTPLAYLSHWRGDLTMHGGAFVADGRAWALTGDREAGKSSMLTALGRRGYPIVADDLVVVGSGFVRAGPACIDLRSDTAGLYPDARSIGFVSGRERHRLTMTAAPAEVAYGGAVLLEWHDAEPLIEELTLEERFRLLDDQHYSAPIGPAPPMAVFDAMEAPMWRLRRRRDWTATDAVIDQVLALVGSTVERQ